MIEDKLLSVDNGIDKIVPADATLVAKEYYTSYSQYVLEYRALPSVYDGLKPVQRRIIYTANQFPMKLMKTAKMVGQTIALHPHGDASISGAIYSMAHPMNALPLFTTKGNFGGINLPAAAPRYTELYLSEIARQNFCQFMDYIDYEIGEIGEQEPSALATLVPYCLFEGCEGIGIGLSTKVLPLNLLDIIDYYIEYIKCDGQLNPRRIKPDVGYVLLDMTPQEIRSAVSDYKGRITVSSIVTQTSNTSFLIEGLYDRSIDAVINKLDKHTGWFTKEQVGFRDASTTSIKYVFEIYDSSVDPIQFKKELIKATSRSGSYTRIMEEDGCAVYASLNYVVSKSLGYLNKVLDKKFATESSKYQKQLDLYIALDACKSAGIFDKSLTQMTSAQLVNLIISTAKCSDEIAQEIIKKPISYLTKSHDKEKQDLVNKMNEISTHDRKKYLIQLYRDFRKAVLPIYESKLHSITSKMMISNPCIKIENDKIRITDGDGIPFENEVYFVSDAGIIYQRPLSAIAAAEVTVQTLDPNEKIIGAASDKDKYIKIYTEFNDQSAHGETIVAINDITYDKAHINFREDLEERIVRVEGLTDLAKDDEYKVKGIRIARTNWVKN